MRCSTCKRNMKRSSSVPDWGYITIAYTLVWGSLAVYAATLARRVTQAQNVARTLRRSLSDDSDSPE